MEYVSRICLDIDGQEITDFEEVEEKDIELYKTVECMNSTGFAEKKARYGVRVQYCIPKDAPEFDFHKVRNGRLTIDHKNGTRISFFGCFPLKIGNTTYGKDEAKKDIDFGATERDPKLQD